MGWLCELIGHRMQFATVDGVRCYECMWCGATESIPPLDRDAARRDEARLGPPSHLWTSAQYELDREQERLRVARAREQLRHRKPH